jgi:Golgi SNAP receptor complex protein 2
MLTDFLNCSKVKKIVEDERIVRGSMERFIEDEQARRMEEEREERRRQERSNPEAYLAQQMQQERVRQRLHGDIASVQRTSRTAHEIREMAFGVLETLRDQNETLQAARDRLLDIANTLGISKTLLRVIERRQTVDQIIVYGAMIGTFLLLVILVYFFRW